MKILLLGINARFTHTNLALYYLRQQIDPKKHKAIILEKTINDFVLDIISEINEVRPDVLCLSIYVWNQRLIQDVLLEIKKILPDLIVVCGGPDISWNPENWLDRYPSIDYIIVGAGEKAFHVLQENDFCINHDIMSAPQPVKNNVIRIKNFPFSSIAQPYQKTDKKILKHRYIYYEASRGCPFKCSYCTSSVFEQQPEYKDFADVKDEIDILLDFEPIIIKFIDRSFNANNDLCTKLWEYIARLDIETIFHFEINPMCLTKEQIEILSTMPRNRIQIEVGIQTTNDRTMKKINRIGSWDEIKLNLFALMPLKNIHKHYDMITGLPDENLADVSKTFNDLLCLSPDVLQLGFLKILPGTQISKETEKWGYKYQENAPYRVLSSNLLSYNEMRQIELVELALSIVYNSNKMCFYSKTILKQGSDGFANPFKYFLSLGTLFQKNNINKASSDMTKIFQLVKEHLVVATMGDTSFCLDSLRFDWFISVKTHFYPDFLEAHVCDKFKDSNYKKVKIAWNEMSSIFSGISHKTKLRNIVFFAAESEEFRKSALMGATGAVKVEKEGVFRINEGDLK